MLLTEKEAREKICPHMVRTSYVKCVASGCMAWRFVRIEIPLEFQNVENPEPPVGYCGLAGKP
jgi:hypothetical protein